MLSIAGLDVALGSVDILRGVRLELPQGSTAGLIGRNGAGKTTLMRAVMGLLAAKAGSMRLGELDLLATPATRRAALGVGYMPEDRRLIPALSVQENVLVPAWASRLANPMQRLEQVYEMIPEVREFAERRAMELSGGQQKLVALARALMVGNKLLLLDEPFEGVAPVLARRLTEVIAGLKQRGLTVLVSESDLKHSAAMLERMYVIDRGVIVRDQVLTSG